MLPPNLKLCFPRAVRLFVVVAVLFLGASGCATLFKGNTDSVSLTTQPSGAYAWVNGAYAGRTPLTVRLDTRRNHTVFFKLPGYEGAGVQLRRSIAVLWLVLDVLAFGLPVIMDAITRAWLEFGEVHVELLETGSESRLDGEPPTP